MTIVGFAVLGHFDKAEPLPAGVQLLYGLQRVLAFPLVTLMERVAGAPFTLPWMLNSLLWGVALYYGGAWLYRRWTQRRSDAS